MASLTSSIGRIIHGTANSILENDVPGKIAEAITTTVKSGISVVEDAVKVVRDLTKPEDDAQPPLEEGGGGS
jgi:hypothetical protein